MKLLKGLFAAVLITAAATSVSANSQLHTEVDYITGNVTVTGIGERNNNVTVKVLSPGNETVFMEQIGQRSSGGYKFEFNTDAKYGKYTIKINDSGTVENNEETFDVFVPKLEAEGAVSGKKIMNINDLDGNENLKINLDIAYNPEQSSVKALNTKLVCAAYDSQGNLLSAKQSENIVNNGGNDSVFQYQRSAEFTPKELTGAVLIKSFVWENGTMKPYTGDYRLAENPYKDSLKILTVGNSHAHDASVYLYELAKGAGIDNVVVGYTFQNGSGIAEHASLLQSDAKYKYNKNTGNGFSEEYYQKSTREAIRDEDWDVILIQEFSMEYGKDAESRTKNIDYIIGEIKKEATNPDVKIGWQMNWAASNKYSKLFDKNIYADSNRWYTAFGEDSDMMFKVMSSDLRDNILSDNKFPIVIYSGTAVQNARTSENLMKADGNMLSWDAIHMDSFGNVLVGLGYLRALGFNIDDIDISCMQSVIDADKAAENPLQIHALTSELFDIMKQAVNAAYENPYAITYLE